MQNSFFDYNSTTPVDPNVRDIIAKTISLCHGNASSLHSRGRKAKEILENSRLKIAQMIGASEHEIYFTSGGTESNNWALKGLEPFRERGKNHIISSETEHSSVYETLVSMEKKGWEVTFLPVDERGQVNPDDLFNAIKTNTAAVSIMAANNETGAIQDLTAIGTLAKERGITFHCDAVQAAGKIPLNVKNVPFDLLSLSSHKIYGPMGIGALYIRRGLSLTPILHGGGQEYGRRSGTENIPFIAGFGEACAISQKLYDHETKRMMDLKKGLYSGLEEKIECIKLNSPFENSLPNTLNVSFPGCESETLVLDLDSAGFQVSAGSACGSLGRKKSRVLKAMGLKPLEVFSAIRISMGRETKEKDVKELVKTLSEVVNQFI